MIVDRITDALAALAGLLLFSLTLLVSLDVALRAVSPTSIEWTLEVSEYHLYAITFLAAPWVLRIGGHICIDLLVGSLPQRVRFAVLRLTNTACATLCAVLLWYSLKTLYVSYASGTLVYQTLIFPEWWQFLLPPVTFVLMICIFVRWVIRPATASAERLQEGL